jgi:chemotaxis protein methyltransferase CheR
MNFSGVQVATFLQQVKDQWGYDFSDYAEASLQRRLQRCMDLAHVTSLEDLGRRIFTDRKAFDWFLSHFTVNVTEMFRDPEFYAYLRTHILSVLETFPNINIWHAGCSSGEEVYSLAILLHEHNLLSRCRIYATDLNPANLEKARAGIIPVEMLKEYIQNYRQSGGIGEFSQYYTARYGNAIFSKELRDRIVFLQHNLVTDGVFNEFQLILCRNVFIYFNRALQEKVLELFWESLSPLGYLALGTKEAIMSSKMQRRFETISKLKVFRKKY